MSHAPVRAIALITIVAASVVGCAGGEEAQRATPHGEKAAPLAAPSEQRSREDTRAIEVETTAEPVPEKAPCPENKGEIRVGSFRRPEGVPPYEILQDERRVRDGACAARLLVDTRASSEADYTLIARDIKARYADRDAVSVEFIDTSRVLDYNGGAVIFNTPDGAQYIGFIYGAPNNKGYIVRAAD